MTKDEPLKSEQSSTTQLSKVHQLESEKAQIEAKLVQSDQAISQLKQELTRLQESHQQKESKIHQLQEELEYYFLLHKDSKKLLDCFSEKIKRAQKLLLEYSLLLKQLR